VGVGVFEGERVDDGVWLGGGVAEEVEEGPVVKEGGRGVRE